MDIDEVGLRNLKSTVGKKAKRKLERACEGCGWITIPTGPQDGTDLSQEEFRDALQ